jgi:hypothetical protein
MCYTALTIMVDISKLANMFSQKTGAQPSVANSVMNAVIGFMMQKGIGNIFSSGGSGLGGIISAISNVIGCSNNNLSPDHDLVKHVQRTCDIQDPQQATQYTQQAVSVMNEHGNSNPQGLQSLLSNLTGGRNKDGTVTEAGQQKKKERIIGRRYEWIGNLDLELSPYYFSVGQFDRNYRWTKFLSQ